MAWSRILACAAVCLLSSTPAAFLAAPQSPASTRLSRDWLNVRSPHFMAVGNAAPSELRGAVLDLEAFRAALTTLFPGLRLDAPVPTVIVVFRDSDAFNRYRPRDASGRPVSGIAGYFSARPHQNLIAFDAKDGRETYSVIFHEFTHYVLARNVTSLPLWLTEGLAEFFSTFEPSSTSGRSIVGRAPEGRLALLRNGSFIPLRELIAPADVQGLWGSDRIATFYAEAWALVHMLAAGPGVPLAGYADAIRTSASPEAAFTKAIGADVATVERQLRQYIARYQFAALTLASAGEPAPALTVESAREADVHAMLGDMLVENGAFEAAAVEIADALALDSSLTLARVAHARLAGYRGRMGDAIEELEAAAQGGPTHFGAQFYLGVALSDARRYDEAERAFDRALAMVPDSAPALIGASVAALALRQDGRAAAAFARALAVDANAIWYRNRAFAAYSIGRDDVVIADAREYLARVGWAQEGAPYAGLIAAISCRRLGRTLEADAILDEAERSVPSKTWTAAVVQYLRRRIDDRDLLGRAKDAGQRTEAHAYVGLMQLLAGHVAAATEHLSWVVTQGTRSYSEYDLARRELARLRAQGLM